MILIIFGTGVDCQVVLSANPAVAPSPKGVSTGCSVTRLEYTDPYLCNRIIFQLAFHGQLVSHDMNSILVPL